MKSMGGGFERYTRRRRCEGTPEPNGVQGVQTGGQTFVVQKHDAKRLHYDFRLEHAGVLKSWAVPKGPSLDSRTRRLAVEVEDHPLEYAGFEGVIPQGEYGAGAVLVWDRGTWLPEGDPAEGLAEGKLGFQLFGEKLQGRWTLVKLAPRQKKANGKDWLLIKRRDEAAREGGGAQELTQSRPESVLSGRMVEALSRDAERKPSST